jgi:cytochrome c oxidase assembly protein Cox11
MRVWIPILILALLASCATPPDVAQGKVTSCDKANRIVTIHDEANPGTTLEFNFAEAEMGADPVPGDVVRIAYHAKGDRLFATRVMKVSLKKRQ